MMCPAKKNLIEKEASLERIKEKMLEVRRAYLKTREGKNCLYITDKVILDYIDKVLNIRITRYENDAVTLNEYCKKRRTSVVDLTKEILSRYEQSNIVIKGMSTYQKRVGYSAKGMVIFKIKDLTVVNMSIKKDAVA